MSYLGVKNEYEVRFWGRSKGKPPITISPTTIGIIYKAGLGISEMSGKLSRD